MLEQAPGQRTGAMPSADRSRAAACVPQAQSVGVDFTFDPAVVLLVAEALYVRAWRVLGVRGYRVPRGQLVAWHAGLLFMAIGLLSPIGGLSEELLVAHMGEHLILADLGAPLLLVGIRSPVYAFLLPRPALKRLARRRRLRAFFRWLRQPLVAVPLWILILYGWHFTFLFENAIRHDWVHVLQHQSFMLGSLLVWWSVIEPKRRRARRAVEGPLPDRRPPAGMLLGMAFIIMGSVAYAEPYAVTAPEHGLSALTDQQVAGGMMMATDLAVMLFALMFFFYRSAQDHDRAEGRGGARVRRAAAAMLSLAAGLRPGRAPAAWPRPADAGGRSSPASARPIRGWSEALNAERFDRAASFFARDAIVQQGLPSGWRTAATAVAFNRSLPCKAAVTDVKDEGRPWWRPSGCGRAGPQRVGQRPGAVQVLGATSSPSGGSWPSRRRRRATRSSAATARGFRAACLRHDLPLHFARRLSSLRSAARVRR